MPDPAPSPELLHALGRLLRGLSALFWGLPATLVICVHSALKNQLETQPWDWVAPVVAAGVLLYGISQLCHFQRQERIWINAVERARMLATVLLGLSPFIYFYTQLPEMEVFYFAVLLLAAFGLVFLYHLNALLLRLAMMLPDETLRQETSLFTTLNQYLLIAVPVCLLAYLVFLTLVQSNIIPLHLVRKFAPSTSAHLWLFLLLTLLPMATTMALIWKIREVVFTSIFGKEK